MRLRTFGPPLIALALLVAACGAYGDDGDGGTTASSGADGGVTQAQADTAMGGLCDIADGTAATEDAVDEAFFTDAHETLHAVADRAQGIDPVVAGSLLEAKAVVEDDLDRMILPASLPDDAQALATAFGAALTTIGLEATQCSSP